ncbi:MAG TPA: glutamyl-tRNA reductase [Longimicrobium sp.]|nr:glutamyl-tRNA reductase [Longimicrobium sp.]
MPVSLVLDFRGADLPTRERFHLPEERVAELYAGSRDGAVREMVLLSTCNRLEVYGAPGEQGPDAVARAVAEIARRWTGDEARSRELLRTATHRSGADAARHLVRVAAGLESQVLGDAQVLGQVRAAYASAREAGTVGPVLHRLFETALRVGKRVQTETRLVGGRSSVGAEAAELTARHAGPPAERRIVVVGCGKTGEQAARRLAKLGARDLVLVNRTPERAIHLAGEVWGRPARWEQMHQELARADVAIVATGADLATVRAASLGFCRRQAGTFGRPLLLVDLSVPRNVEPEAAGLPGVTLMDMDALRGPLAQAEAARRAAIPAAERIADEELARFAAWLAEGAAREAVAPLREALEEVCRRELAFATGPDSAQALTSRIVAKLLARPMSSLRAATARGEELTVVTEMLRHLFDRPGARRALSEPAAAEMSTEAASPAIGPIQRAGSADLAAERMDAASPRRLRKAG